jgi:hypothetical protein
MSHAPNMQPTTTDRSNNPAGPEALVLAPCSAGLCMRCEHWEPRDAMRELGYVPSAAIGYCPLFAKLTEATHGINCTAYSPNAKDEPRRERRTKI